MNRISTREEMQKFQAKMMNGMYNSLDEFVERINSHQGTDIDDYHKAFRNLARQMRVYQDGILESFRELHHDLYNGDDEAHNES
jgi:hypothetical protein